MGVPNNGQQESLPIPDGIVLPEGFENASLLTGQQMTDKGEIAVTLIILAPGRTFSMALKPADAQKWGAQIASQGRAADTGLIVP